jgi:hypothetical protein
MKLRDLMRGTRAIHVVEIPLVNVPNSGAEESPELVEARKRDAQIFGTTIEQMPTKAKVGLRVLLPGQWADVQTAARQFAIDRGNPSPTEDDPNYNLGTQINTLCRACVDVDSDPSNPELYEPKPEEWLTNPNLTRDSLTYLCEEWEWWNDRVNPQIKNFNDYESFAFIGQLVGDPDRFLLLRPGVQRALVHFMAVQLWSLLTPKSPSSGGSDENTSNGPKAPSAQLQ